MKNVPLKASARSKEESAIQLRLAGKVPGVVYGNVENTLITCAANEIKKAYTQAGESTLVELTIDDKKLPVLFHAVDLHPVTDMMTHVDFYAVDMKKEVEAEVHLRFEGEAPAVKDLSAILVTAMHEVTVRCLPANLPHDLEVDLSKLTEFGSTLTVADIKVPEGVVIINEPEATIMIAQEPREEVVEEPVAAEGEVPADGATPAAEGAPAAGDAEKKDE